jgi:hypothetical protein
LPVNVTISAGPAPLTCWSTKPMAIGESGFIRDANSKPCWPASLRGRPGCRNWMRGVWKSSSPRKPGDATGRPLRLLLPCSHSAALVRQIELDVRERGG